MENHSTDDAILPPLSESISSRHESRVGLTIGNSRVGANFCTLVTIH